jgi:hypothetical protein
LASAAFYSFLPWSNLISLMFIIQQKEPTPTPHRGFPDLPIKDPLRNTATASDFVRIGSGLPVSGQIAKVSGNGRVSDLPQRVRNEDESLFVCWWEE